VRKEHLATREHVTLFDLSSFGKIEVTGQGALSLLQRVADSDINKPVGTAIYTQFLNSRGGVEADVTISRLATDCFMVITGSAFIGNDLAWLRMHQQEQDGPLVIRDTTLDYACLALWGPKSRLVFQKITPDDISNESLPYLHAKFIDINGVRVWAQRVSYVGELGWELYIPPDRAVLVWDALMKAGEEFGIEVGGYKVLDSLRLEKGYRYYSADVTMLETPLEAGLGFCVDFNKGDFVGRDALLRQKQAGLTRKLCTVVLDGDDFTQIYGGEAILHTGKVVTRLRSGGYGYTLHKNILYAYLPIAFSQPGTHLEVDLIEGRYQGKVTSTVLYDPGGERLRS
jgi:4-methylaminobutanoate oxidase (formaldehyde-forming)